MSPRSLHGRGLSAAFMASLFLCPSPADAGARSPRRVQLGTVGLRAFQYFAPLQSGSGDEYLLSLRPAAVSTEKRGRALASLRKEDLIVPSAPRQAKLDALHPVLKYLDRDAVVEIKILRLGVAWAGFLDGAAVLVSEGAIDLLTADELQAVVAHELAHEYFAAEYGAARDAKRYDTVREIELRCDAISIVTMKRLGLDPAVLLSAVAKLTRFNDRRGFPNNPNLVPSTEERRSFSRAVVALIEDAAVTARKDGDVSDH